MASLKDLILQLSPEQQHYIARLVASMPESEGGLGMSLKNTAEQRAKALGFDYDSDLFHGVEGEFKGQEFNPEILQSRDYGWFGSGVYLTSDPDSASAYADPLSKDKFIGQHVMPVVARKGKIFNYENANPLPEGPALNEFNRALDELGYNTVEVPNEYADPKYATNHETVIRNPKNVRSKFAAFNPWLKESSNLLASHPLASVGAGLAATGGLSGMAKEYLSQPMYQGPEMARVSKYTGVYPITRLENLKNTLSALPVTGEILAGAEGLQAASEGKWREAGLGALGALPMMGGMIKASHGSPHAHTKFDFSKIGTGEGAQAYGHGGYFAEGFDSPIAKQYQKNLSNFYEPFLGNRAGSELSDMDLEVLKALEIGKRDAGQFPHNTVYYAKKYAEGKPELLSALNEMPRDVKFGERLNQGNLYNVELKWPDAAREASDPLGEHHLLDWDDLLSKQPTHIQQALKRIGDKLPRGQDEWDIRPWMQADPLASTFHDSAVRDLGVSPEDLSKMLLQEGIPGIRYLDQGSRGTGEGTRNYVMFDDRFPNIVSRNGVSLADLLRK